MLLRSQCVQERKDDDVVKIYRYSGVGFGPIFFTHTTFVDYPFGPRITN